MVEEIPALLWTPESIALHMRHTVDRLEKSAGVVKKRHEEYLAAKREHMVVKAQKRQDLIEQKMSQADREDKATIDTMDLFKDMDTAMVGHAYARDLSNVLEKKLSALQTQAKLIMLEWNVGNRV